MLLLAVVLLAALWELYKLVIPDEDEMQDERSVEGGIRRLKEERPKLFGEVRRSGANVENEEGGREDERDRINRSRGGSNVDAGIQRLRGVQRKS